MSAGSRESDATLRHHLLVVDDDERLRRLLAQYLRRGGFLVSTARDAEQARRLLQGLAFDLVILDVMMPKTDGLTLTRDLRGSGADVPILLLTARGDTEDRIAGLEAGADDYLPKPFEPRELLLRINAILRRRPDDAARTTPRRLRLGALRFDVARGELTDADGPVHLTATESAVMGILAARPNEPVSRAELVEKLGRGQGRAQERAVDVQITRLRRKIEPDPKNPRYLRTVRGEGYMLVPD